MFCKDSNLFVKLTSGKIYHKKVVDYANTNPLFINVLNVLLQRKHTL